MTSISIDWGIYCNPESYGVYFSRGKVQSIVYRHLAVISFDHVITRRARQRRFVDLHMHMPANSTLGRAAEVRICVEQALMSALPGLRATIQLLASDVEAHLDDPQDMK